MAKMKGMGAKGTGKGKRKGARKSGSMPPWMKGAGKPSAGKPPGMSSC